MDSKELGKICGSSSYFVKEKPYSMWELTLTSKCPDYLVQIEQINGFKDFKFFEFNIL